MAQEGQAPLKILVVHDELVGESAESRALGDLLAALKELEVNVVLAHSAGDGDAVLRSDPSIMLAVVDWDLSGDTARTQRLLWDAREHNELLPLWLMADRTSLEDIPTSVTDLSDEYVYLLDDTADWIAGRLLDGAARYRAAILPPMFAALVDFAGTHEYSWHTPGHEGGRGLPEVAHRPRVLRLLRRADVPLRPLHLRRRTGFPARSLGSHRRGREASRGDLRRRHDPVRDERNVYLEPRRSSGFGGRG